MSIFNKTYQNTPDADLVLLYNKKQNQRVMNELFRRYHYVIRTVCWKYLKKEDCKDVASEVFEKFLKQIRQEVPKNIGGWIYTVSRNACLHKLRKNGKVIEIDIEHLSNETFDSSNDNQEDLLVYLDQAIKQLKDKQKQCIELFYLKEMSYGEISQQTGESLKSVKSCLQNGKRNIQIFIEKNLKKA